MVNETNPYAAPLSDRQQNKSDEGRARIVYAIQMAVLGLTIVVALAGPVIALLIRVWQMK